MCGGGSPRVLLALKASAGKGPLTGEDVPFETNPIQTHVTDPATATSPAVATTTATLLLLLGPTRLGWEDSFEALDIDP